MDTAVSIMNRRVNGLGVSEAEVQTQGDRNIIVNIPKGTNSEQARQQVGTTAKLYFRPVLTVAAGTPTKPAPSTTPSPSASKGADKNGDKNKPSSTPSAKPSSNATPQGRAVTDALKADGKPNPKGTPSTTPKPGTTPGTTPPCGQRSGRRRQAPEGLRVAGLLHQGVPRQGRLRQQGHRHDRVLQPDG